MNETYHHNALPPGTMLHEHEIVRVLGEGSFGIVYLAKGKYLDDLVAIKEYLPAELATRIDGKTIAPTSSANEGNFRWGREKFLEEARLLWQLANPQPHPNIVAVRRFFELNGSVYMVMDYEEGESLSAVLKRRGPLPEAAIWPILEPLLEGLEKVHAAHITHRDIKPDNILIRADGSPVLLDFGAARLALDTRTQSAFNALSPAYAAIEQHLAEGLVGPWTDIYALGATLYRLVTGKLPQAPLERTIEATHRPAVEAAGGRYSEALLKAIDAALALQAKDRPQSVADWRALMRARPGKAPDDATAIISRNAIAAPRSRRIAALASAAAGLVAVVAAGVYLAGGEADTEDPGQTAALSEGGETIRQDAEAELQELQRQAEEETRRLAKMEAEEQARRLVQAQRRAIEAEAQRLAEAEAQRLAEAEAERQALEEARLLAEATARREAQEKEARLLAEAAARREAEEQARRDAEAEIRRRVEEAARLQAEAERQAAQAPQLVAKRQALFAVKNVNVRAAPFIESDKLATVKAGSLLQVTASLADGSWHRVKLPDDRTGFVWAPLLSNQPPRIAAPPDKQSGPQQANLTASPVKSPAAFERYLAEHRRDIRRKLNDYNRRHRVIVAPSAYTDNVEVVRIHKAEALMFSGDSVQVRFTLQVGRVRKTSGTKVFEMQWVEDDLEIVSHK